MSGFKSFAQYGHDLDYSHYPPSSHEHPSDGQLHAMTQLDDVESGIQLFAQAMRSKTCIACRKTLVPDFKNLYAQLRHKNGSIITCLHCSDKPTTCMGCNQFIKGFDHVDCKHPQATLFVVWAALCKANLKSEGIRLEELDTYLQTDGNGQPRESGKPHPMHTSHDTNSFYETDKLHDSGKLHATDKAKDIDNADTGHDGSSNQQQTTPVHTMTAAECALKQAGSDDRMSEIMYTLSRGLRFAHKHDSFDQPTWYLVYAMLIRSGVLDMVTELLRNDSIDDMLKRSSVYRDCAALVEQLTQIPSINALVIDQRTKRQKGRDLLHLSYGSALPVVPGETEVCPSITSALENIGTQCSILLKNLPKGRSALYLMATRYDKLNKAVKSLKPQFSGSQTVDSDSSKSAKQLDRVNEVPDELLLQSFDFTDPANDITSTDDPRRLKTLMKEVASMTTSLPEGIYVRYGTSRMDCMKVLIAGPLETPYENGLFEFDLFCPADYPKAPPQVFFRGASDCAVPWNPYLHDDGEVCLSILGTWFGPCWEPGTSTIYQVLVSIQAMIFCAKPWYNDHGNDRIGEDIGHGEWLSQVQNRRYQAMTLRFAILKWLRLPDIEHAVWANVVKGHYRANATRVLQTFNEWLEEEDAVMNSYNTSQWPRFPEGASLPYSVVRMYDPPKRNIRGLKVEVEKTLAQYTQL